MTWLLVFVLALLVYFLFAKFLLGVSWNTPSTVVSPPFRCSILWFGCFAVVPPKSRTHQLIRLGVGSFEVVWWRCTVCLVMCCDLARVVDLGG